MWKLVRGTNGSWLQRQNSFENGNGDTQNCQKKLPGNSIITSATSRRTLGSRYCESLILAKRK